VYPMPLSRIQPGVTLVDDRCRNQLLASFLARPSKQPLRLEKTLSFACRYRCVFRESGTALSVFPPCSLQPFVQLCTLHCPDAWRWLGTRVVRCLGISLLLVMPRCTRCHQMADCIKAEVKKRFFFVSESESRISSAT
jgi:hypothetical protein